ncbi:MAG: TRAP transporter small permease [Mailhella sp.]
MNRFFKIIDVLTEWLGMLFLVGMVAGIAIQVIWRYILNNPLPWPEEASRYMFLWSTYLAISICMKGDGHLRITILPDMCSDKGRKLLDLFAQLINLVFFLLIVKLSIDMTIDVHEMEQMAIALPIPIWIVWLGIPVFCFLVLLQSIKNFYLILTDRLSSAHNEC